MLVAKPFPTVLGQPIFLSAALLEHPSMYVLPVPRKKSRETAHRRTRVLALANNSAITESVRNDQSDAISRRILFEFLSGDNLRGHGESTSNISGIVIPHSAAPMIYDYRVSRVRLRGFLRDHGARRKKFILGFAEESMFPITFLSFRLD